MARATSCTSAPVASQGAAMLLIELMRWLPIRRDSAHSHPWVAPAERVGAAEATILLNQRAPHELQPCKR